MGYCLALIKGLILNPNVNKHSSIKFEQIEEEMCFKITMVLKKYIKYFSLKR